MAHCLNDPTQCTGKQCPIIRQGLNEQFRQLEQRCDCAVVKCFDGFIVFLGTFLTKSETKVLLKVIAVLYLLVDPLTSSISFLAANLQQTLRYQYPARHHLQLKLSSLVHAVRPLKIISPKRDSHASDDRVEKKRKIQHGAS